MFQPKKLRIKVRHKQSKSGIDKFIKFNGMLNNESSTYFLSFKQLSAASYMEKWWKTMDLTSFDDCKIFCSFTNKVQKCFLFQKWLMTI